MKIAYKHDSDGYYLEPIEIYPIDDEYSLPPNATFVPLPQPNWKPKFNGEEWIETITEEELNHVKKPVNPDEDKSEIELLKEKNAILEAAVLELTEISSQFQARNIELETGLLEMTKVSFEQQENNAELETAFLETSRIDSSQNKKALETEDALLESTIFFGGMLL